VPFGWELFVPISHQLPDAFVLKVIFIRSSSSTVIPRAILPVDIPCSPSFGWGFDKTGGDALVFILKEKRVNNEKINNVSNVMIIFE